MNPPLREFGDLLTPHFSVAEALVTRHPEHLAAQRRWFTAEVAGIFREYLLAVWEPMRAVLDRPIVVTSAVRCPELNSDPAVGGDPNSWHLVRRPDGKIGAATDNVPVGIPLVEAVSRIASSAIPFDEVILEYRTWLHVGWRRNGIPRREVLMKFAGTGFELFNPKDPRLVGAGEVRS